MHYLKRYFKLLPIRIGRIWALPIPTKWYDWPIDFIFKLLDITGTPELFEWSLSIVKRKYRHPNQAEIRLILEYYSGLLDIDAIRINESINKTSSKFAHAFVTFNTINYNGAISDAVFIHELMHVLQYQKYGSLYIYRALKAQNTKQAYDYGGLYGLNEAALKNVKLTSFNFEQQAMIMEDYYRFVSKTTIPNKKLSSKIENLYISFYKQIFDESNDKLV